MIHYRQSFVLAFVIAFSCPFFSFTVETIDVEISESDIDKAIEHVVESDTFEADVDSIVKEIEKQTTDEALRPIIDPEGFHREKQIEDNQKILWKKDIQIRKTMNRQGEIKRVVVPIVMYKGDLYNILLLSSSWGLEWGVYKLLMAEFVRLEVEHILNNVTQISDYFDMVGTQELGDQESELVEHAADDEFIDLQTLLTRPKESLWFSKQSKKIFKTLFVYLFLSEILKGTRNYLQLNHFGSSYLSLVTKGIQEADENNTSLKIPPLPVVSVGHKYVSGFLEAFDPSLWTDSINSLFRYFNVLPQWTDSMIYRTAVQITALLLWLRSCDANLVKHYLVPHIEKNQREFEALIEKLRYLQCLKIQGKLTNDYLSEYTKSQEELCKFMTNGLAPGFRRWVTSKALRTQGWNALIDTIVAIPAYYKAYKGLSGVYQELSAD